MSRDQLLDISARFLNWVSSHAKDPSELAAIVAKDVVVLTPFPGTTPDFTGLLAHQQKAHVGSSDFKLTIKDAIADEVQSTVVHFLELTGTHNGYYEPCLYLILGNGWGFHRLENNFISMDLL